MLPPPLDNLEALLALLRQHGVSRYSDGVLAVEFAPAGGPARPDQMPSNPADEIASAMQRLDTLLQPRARDGL